jgi:lysylphosphatidylglycerol synthetase-like protein (DUF2156 family)
VPVTAPRARTSSPTVQRYAYVPVVDGPHGRLGLLWFLVAAGAAVLGQVAVGVLFAGLAAVAALQTSVAWRKVGFPDDRVVAGTIALVVGLVALLGTAAAGAAIVVGVVASVVAAVAAPGRRERVVGRAGRTIRTWLGPAVAAVSVTAIARLDMAAFVILLVLISGYEVGDYLVGTGAEGLVEGPIAGMAAVFVLTFTEAVFQLGPFDARAAWVFGGLVAVLAPLGAPLASAMAPAASAKVPALRRLDAWLLVAPVWCLLLWDYLP